MFKKFLRKRRVATTRPGRKAYELHKEAARAKVHARLAYFGQRYGVSWNRVAIRDQRRRWGSCSSRGNLNFNYRLIFLPDHLFDYIIIHELCHLVEMNHGPRFWALVAQECPGFEACITELRHLERSTRLNPTALLAHVHGREVASRPVAHSAIITV